MTVDSDTGAMVEPSAQEKVRCYFDVTLGGLPAGRIVFELFPAVAPKTCENFRALCTGEAGIGQKTGKPLHYKGIIFHRVVKDFMIQSGDFSNGNGTGGESIYGGIFDDEPFTLKHDRAFLLSMANRGKNTNGSQFFITTQPAPHLDSVHVVFGHVVSGQDLVRQLEQLPVDRNSRPLQDAMVSNCGELVRQIKAKKEKKNKKAAASSEESEDETSRKRKKDKKKKRGKESSPRTKRAPDADASIEEGELEDEIHPMATVTKIDPDEIPEVSNKYLMRNDAAKRATVQEDDRKRDNRAKEQRGFGWMKKNVPTSRSGRIIKGRGHFRYRTPSRSRSRSRSQTPIHWRAAQKRTIKMTDLEKLEDEKRQRESEIKRREAERKKRHEELAKGVSKKSFFELNQEQAVTREKSTSESPDAAANAKRATDPAKTQEEPVRGKSNGSIDMNALDYEHHPAGTSDTEPDEATHKKSDSLAKALGVEPKKKSNDAGKADERRKPADDRKRDRSRSRSRDRRRGGGDGYRGRSPPGQQRGGGGGGGGNRNRQPFGFGSGAQHYNRYNQQQQQGSNRRYGGGNNVGGSYYSRPRGRFGGNNERYDRDRSRRSRSHEGGGFSRRSRRERSVSHSRSRTPEHRRRRKDNSSTGSSQERNERSRRNRSVTPTDRRSASRPVTSDKTKRESIANGKELDKFRDKSPGSVATAIVVAATAAVEAAKLPAVSIKTEDMSEEEKARMQKEKMLKRAETLLLLKSHMEKEIEEQQRKAREKQQQQLLLRKQKEEQEARALDAVMDLAQLKQLKKETIQKLNAQEAAQRILETVVTNVSAVAGSGATSQKKKSKNSSNKRRSSRSSSSSSSSSSAASKKEKSRKKRKDKKRKARRHSSSSS
ncbi:peptidyl-prolyl cis-trans isomerase G [Anopheles funestus]|uniref:peptidyl-prolyl cis-trans isomerase G n=1 Tax=Anopheles funestus TaxID=62324 RepID=UPI0020C5F78A|nr:peptidyl-prolyl cis-trans isomerase G [Anopheles funestus]